ncbi:DUF308 domain-containing protein [Oxalobacter vibrioformis]|uniref:DUF308 domain-containing protein n=1 Tax=Oxalobacter vibrioformis TaxID=933080 RepID=A0A9E9P2W2_9BURK|nr:DUF308 domain-containing protein [Oxalobacter vibrioformis]WAW09418.1 DUF308 domain-containing protein [Oxalobacter vibrioformis]
MSTLEMSPISRSWWLLVVYGIAAIFFGIVALASPLGAAVAMAWVIGILALGEGVASLIAAFSKNISLSKGWLLFYAVCSILFGLVTIMNPEAVASMLLIFFAVWLIIAGIYRIVFAIQARKRLEGEWMLIVSGVLAIVLGAMLIAQPLTGMIITTIWIGAMVLVYGIFQIMAGIQLRKL